MAIDTFTWRPNSDEWISNEAPKNFVTKYGDGYEQRINDGINNEPYEFSVAFSGNFALANQIRQFLRDMSGVKSFNWVNPFSEAGIYVARSWSFKRDKDGIFTVSTKFEQVFE